MPDGKLPALGDTKDQDLECKNTRGRFFVTLQKYIFTLLNLHQ